MARYYLLDTMVDVINWMKVEDKVESMKRSKRSKGGKEIGIKMDAEGRESERSKENSSVSQTLEQTHNRITPKSEAY